MWARSFSALVLGYPKVIQGVWGAGEKMELSVITAKSKLILKSNLFTQHGA